MDKNFSAILKKYKVSATKRCYKFYLEDAEAYRLFKGKCHYCGVGPSNTLRIGHITFIYNGIDRINNDDDYILYNCVSCCKQCNFAKRNSLYEDFVAWVRRAYFHLRAS